MLLTREAPVQPLLFKFIVMRKKLNENLNEGKRQRKMPKEKGNISWDRMLPNENEKIFKFNFISSIQQRRKSFPYNHDLILGKALNYEPPFLFPGKLLFGS